MGLMRYTFEVTSDGMIYIQSLRTVSSGIRVLLRYYLDNFRGSVSTTNERYLLSSRLDGLRWYDVDTKSYDYRFRHSSNIKGMTSTI
jgi:hypothetical protein